MNSLQEPKTEDKKHPSHSPRCTFCKSSLSHRILERVERYGFTYDVYECLDCRLGVTHPMPTRDYLAHLYSSGNYRTDKGKRFGPIIEALIHLGRIMKRRSIQQYIPRGKILDIGCGRGLFLDVMQRNGWNVLGTELNEKTASYAAEVYGLKVLTGEIKKFDLPSESVDVINLTHVYEHLEDPAEALTEYHRLLRKDGLLVLAVPNLSSLQYKIGKGSWFLLDLPYHLYHFTEDGLEKILTKHGFKVMKTKRFNLEYSPFGWLQTLLNVSGIHFNLLYDLLKSRELRGSEMKAVTPAGILATLALLPLYFPISIALSFLEPLVFRTGGSIEVYAIKE